VFFPSNKVVFQKSYLGYNVFSLFLLEFSLLIICYRKKKKYLMNYEQVTKTCQNKQKLQYANEIFAHFLDSLVVNGH